VSGTSLGIYVTLQSNVKWDSIHWLSKRCIFFRGTCTVTCLHDERILKMSKHFTKLWAK